MPSESSSRERLLECASQLIHARGYESVGVAELCSAADVRKGSFYYHFDSKEDLALAMVDRIWRDRREVLFEPAFGDPTRSAEEQFAIYTALLADGHRERFVEHGQINGCRFGNLAIELSTTHPDIQARIRTCLEEMAEYFERALQGGIDSGELDPDIDVAEVAQAICAHMEGLLLLAKVRNDPEVITRLGDDAMRLAAA
ncbi:MAG: TetR/AcrR family transcriptional regulator [Acidimicrobiales bacterium]